MIPPRCEIPWRGKAGDVAHHLSTVTAQGSGAKVAVLPPRSTGRTDCPAGADRQARSLHGRNRAFLVRTRKFRPPVRESPPVADPPLVRVNVARPQEPHTHGGVAHRHRQERREINHALVRLRRRSNSAYAADNILSVSDEGAWHGAARRHSGVGDGFGDRIHSAVG
jgi:hypothetical protein